MRHVYASTHRLQGEYPYEGGDHRLEIGLFLDDLEGRCENQAHSIEDTEPHREIFMIDGKEDAESAVLVSSEHAARIGRTLADQVRPGIRFHVPCNLDLIPIHGLVAFKRTKNAQ